jgi:preprotein translocase subunit YajC
MTLFSNILADAAPQQNLAQTGIMVLVALLFFYFILWRPEQKRRKAIESKRSALKKGDRVTAMGIVGTILKITDTTVVMSTAGESKIEVLKAAITDVHADEPVTATVEVDSK